MFIFFLIAGSGFALVMALFASYTVGHMVGFERGEQDHLDREQEAAITIALRNRNRDAR